MIFFKELRIKAETFINNIQAKITKVQKGLSRSLAPILLWIRKIYATTLWAVSTACEYTAWIIHITAKSIIFFSSKTCALYYHIRRKVYVWKVLSVRKQWYITKKGYFYNPKLRATIYPTWECTWNITRFADHYKGFESKENAQDIAFKMWMKKRRLKNRLDEYKHEIKIPINLKQKILHNKVQLRKATPQDTPILLALMKHLGYTQSDENMKTRIQAYSTEHDRQIIIAERGKKIVGFIAFVIYDMFATDGKRCRIEGLVGDENPHDLGVKRKLMQAVEAFARDNQGKIIDLTLGSQHTKDGSHDFYKFLGYDNDGSVSKVYLKKEL